MQSFCLLSTKFRLHRTHQHVCSGPVATVLILWTKADSRPANEWNIALSLSSVIVEPRLGLMKEGKHDRDRDTQNLGFSDSLSRVAKLQYPGVQFVYDIQLNREASPGQCLVTPMKMTWHVHVNQSSLLRTSHSQGFFLLLPRDFRLGFKISQVIHSVTKKTMSETENCQVSYAADSCSFQCLKLVSHWLFPHCGISGWNSRFVAFSKWPCCWVWP